MGEKVCARCGEAISLDDLSGQRSPPARVKSPFALTASSPKLKAPLFSRSGGGPAVGKAKPRSSFADDTTRIGMGEALPAFVACPACGSDVISGHKFCGQCGHAMASPAGAPAAKVADKPKPAADRTQPQKQLRSSGRTQFFGAMQASRAKLVVIKGDGMDGVSFTLAGDEHLVGRSGAAILFEDDAFISPTHANFFYNMGSLMVRDEGSINGVYIRIQGSVSVQLGDRFLVGEQVLEVQPPPAEMGPEALEDGTYFFASPPKPTYFQIVQPLLGGAQGMVYQAIKPDLDVGREDSDINFPDDPFISGHHARISLVEDQLTLTDLDSKNGTFLRINGEYALKHGDYVFMGQQLLRVEIV
jgi:pSer/pThr/pTyr-binding forkhead associated (FHA) protein